MDRVRTFYRIAKENGRRLVVKLKDCYYYYLKYMSQDGKLGVPNYDDDEDIVIYKPKQVGLWHLRRRRLFYGENARRLQGCPQCKDGS
jgi:mRNA degradation ribonuclease J1/J2